MGVASLIGRGFAGGASGSFTLAKNLYQAGPAGQAALSAGIGGALSLPQAMESNTLGGALETIGSGMAEGAIFSLAADAGMKFGAKGLKHAFNARGIKNAKGFKETMAALSASPASKFAGATMDASRSVMNVASKGLQYSPGTVLGAGAAVAGVGYMATQGPGLGQSMSSPTMDGVEMNANYNEQAGAAQLLQMNQYMPTGTVGSAPQMMGRMNRAMMQSTQGLVQGMHRGRHG